MPQDTVQRDRALAKAQWVRSQRAELKRALKDKRVDPIRLLRGSDPEWERIVAEMRLDRVLDAVPGIGEVTRADILMGMGLSGSLTLVALTFERREDLARVVHEIIYGESPIIMQGSGDWLTPGGSA